MALNDNVRNLSQLSKPFNFFSACSGDLAISENTSLITHPGSQADPNITTSFLDGEVDFKDDVDKERFVFFQLRRSLFIA